MNNNSYLSRQTTAGTNERSALASTLDPSVERVGSESRRTCLALSSGFDTPLTDVLLPLALVAVAAALTWPVVFRAIFGDLLYSDPDEIYDEVVGDDE